MFVTAPAGDPRLFVVERAGRVRVIQNGVLQTAPVADFSALVSTTGERGFLGMAFAPDFETSHAFYVNYTRNTGNGDYVTGRIGSFVYDPLTHAATDFMDLTQFLNPNLSVIGRFDLVSFGEDGFGELYVVDFDGEIYRINYNVIPEPSAWGLILPGLLALIRPRGTLRGGQGPG